MKTTRAPRGALALVVVLLVATLVGVTATGAGATGADAAARRPAPRPNILFVLTDDLAAGDEAHMPKTQELVADAGASFANYFISDSVCCPSRVTTLRGQFAHNTGVKTNGGGNGGFETAYISGVEHDTIATDLQSAGYRTGLFGKYLNKYPGTAGERYIPPGWSAWSSPVGGDPYTQRNYVLNHNGQLEHHGNRPQDHADSVFIDQTQGFIERAAKDRVPFFAYVNVYAPHSPAHPADADRNSFADLATPHTDAYNQADVSKMPSFVRSLPEFTSQEENAITRLHRRRIESLQAVDRGRRASRHHVAVDQAARQHVHHLHVGQRVPPRRPPSPGRQGHCLRHRHPRAAVRHVARASGRARTRRGSRATSTSRPRSRSSPASSRPSSPTVVRSCPC